MQAQKPSNSTPPDEIEISLVDMVRAISAGRTLIGVFTALCVALALAGAFVTARYKSESYYHFTGAFKLGEGLMPESYDRFINLAKMPERLETYLQAMQLDTLPEAQTLRALFASREGLLKQIAPLYSSLEQSKLGNRGQVLGIKLELTGKHPLDTPRTLALLGRYLADLLVYDLYQDTLAGKIDGALTRSEEIENELFTLTQERPHLLRQQMLVAALIEKYTRFFGEENPARARGETARARTDGTGGTGSLAISTEASLGTSPIVQLLNLQLELAKLDQQLEQLERQQEQASLTLAFYRQARQFYRDAQTGERFFTALAQQLQTAFQQQDMNNDIVKEAFNRLSVEVQQAQSFWQEGQRRLVPPSQTAVSTARYALVAAVALLVGLFVSMLLVLLRAWWREARGEGINRGM